MSLETQPSPETVESELYKKIDTIRKKSLTHLELNEIWNDEVFDFNKRLQEKAQALFAEERPWWAVREWHLLVGSTPETHPVSLEAEEFIKSEIAAFIAEMETRFDQLDQ